MSKTNNLRQRLLGAKTDKRTQTITLDVDGERMVVEVREMSFARSNSIHEECMKTVRGPQGQELRISLNKLRLAQVVECTYDPETGERVFRGADRGTLAELPSNSWLAKLTKAVGEVNGTEDKDVDLEEHAAVLHELSDAYERLGEVALADKARERAQAIEAQMAADEEDVEGNSRDA